MANGHSEWMHSHGIVPIARTFGDYRYRIYFSPRDRQNRSNVSWLDIDIRDPTRSSPVGKAVADPGAAGMLRRQRRHGMLDRGTRRRRASLLSGLESRGHRQLPCRCRYCHTPAGDPDRPFERISRGPILDRSMEEPVFVADPAVLIENGRWRMWYQSGRPWTAAMGIKSCRPTTFATPNRPTASLEPRGRTIADIRAPGRSRDRAFLSVA